MSRFTLPVVSHVFLVRGETVLLARRAGTGFEDGKYGPVGGHLEPGETIFQAAIRECEEEIGVGLEADGLELLGVTHYTSDAGDGLDFFFRATRWAGEPAPVADCDDLLWCRLGELPETTIPFVRRALERHFLEGRWFDETGYAE